MIYLDNAATTKINDKVLEAMMPYMTEYYANTESKYYDNAEKCKKALKESRKLISNYIGCEEDELIFTSGSTESNNSVLKSLALTYPEKKHIVTTRLEHSSIYKTCEFLKTYGYDITYLNVDSEGNISLEKLENSLRDDTLLVTIMYVNNEIGKISPIKEIGEICHKHHVLFHSDFTQAVGKVDTNISDVKIDFVTFNAHKIYGPKGIGALVIRKDDLGVRRNLVPLIHGGEQELGYRAGTVATFLIVGFAKAIELAFEDYNDNLKRYDYIKQKLVEKLTEAFNNDIEIINNFSNVAPGYLSIRFKGFNNSILLKDLSDILAASTGSACSNSKPSRILHELGVEDKVVRETVRITFSPYLDIDKEISVLDNL